MNNNVYDVKRIIKRRIDYIKDKNKNHQEKKYWDGVSIAYMHFHKDIEGMTEIDSRTNTEKNINILKESKKVVIPRLVVNITDRCTLKCKECSVLIPYLKNHGEANADLVIADLNKIFDVIDECICLEFIGGEPLLYNQLGTLINYAQKSKKIKMIEITTNATIIPSETLTRILENDKILVQISEYKGVSMQKIEELKNHFKKSNIKFKILKMDRWYAYGNADKRGRSKKELEYCYYYCNDNKMCRTLYDGKLFVCGRAAALYSLDEGYLTDTSSYFEIKENRNVLGEDLLNFYMNKTYAEACDFCDISRDNLKSIAVAEQLKC